jgi:hypothetical protein
VPNHSKDDLERRLDAWAASKCADPSLGFQKSIQQALVPSLKPVKPLPSTGRLVLEF